MQGKAGKMDKMEEDVKWVSTCLGGPLCGVALAVRVYIVANISTVDRKKGE